MQCILHGCRHHCHIISRPAFRASPRQLPAHTIACPGCFIDFFPVTDPLPAGNTFGKAIAGILAHSKGRSIGIYEDKEKDEEGEKEKAAEEEKKGVKKVDVFNMKVGLAFICIAALRYIEQCTL